MERTERIDARRNEILDAATKIFSEKGFHTATIRDIAREAGIADGTIYIYFENKTALLIGILDRINETERREDQLAKADHQDFHTFVRAYVRHRFERLSQVGFEAFRIMLSELLVNQELREVYYTQVIEPTYEIAEKHMLQWVEAGKIKVNDARLSLRMVGGITLGLFVLRTLGDKELEARWDQVPDTVADLLLAGVKSTEGDLS